MKRLIDRRNVELDPGLAKGYLVYNTYEMQRVRLDLEWAEILSQKIVNGLFRYAEVAFVSVLGGPDIMMNGQHCCYAVISANITVPCVLERYAVDDLIELAELYRQFEIKIRTLGILSRSEAASLRLNWPNWITRLVVSALSIEHTAAAKLNPEFMPYLNSESKSSLKKSISKERRVELLKRYVKEGQFLCDILAVRDEQKCALYPPNIFYKQTKKTEYRHIARGSVAYVMFKTWRINSDDAAHFWIDVRDGVKLTEKMPQIRLRDFLISAGGGYHEKILDHEYVYRSILAWNAFRNGKPTNLAYRKSYTIPKLI